MARENMWLGRFSDPLPVRSQGAFHVVSVARRGAARSIVIVGGRAAERTGVARALAEIERAHRAIRHPAIPSVLELGEAEGHPYLELDCDAVADADEVLRLLADAREKFSYAQGDTLFARFREALQAAHAVIDPQTNAPYCLGHITLGNILFSSDGRMWFLGFGYNFAALKEDGTLEGLGPVYQAPEVWAGAPASPGGDYVALLKAARALTAYADVAELARTFLEVGSPASTEAFEIYRWFDTHYLAQRPEARPPIEVGIERSERLRTILGGGLDDEGLRQRVASLLADKRVEGDSTIEGALTVAQDAAWVELEGGRRQMLGRAGRRMLKLLLDAHQNEPGRGTSVWDLLECGWPGEDPHPEVGRNRVYVAIARLKALGLRHLIERTSDGYRIAPNATFRVAT